MVYVTEEVIVTTTYCPTTSLSGKIITLSSTTVTKTFSTLSLVAVTQVSRLATAQLSRVAALGNLSAVPTKNIDSLGPLIPISGVPFLNSTTINDLKTEQSATLKPESKTVAALSGLSGVDQKSRSLHPKSKPTTPGSEVTSISVPLVEHSSQAGSGPLSRLSLSSFGTEQGSHGGSVTVDKNGSLGSATSFQAISNISILTATTNGEIELAASAGTASPVSQVSSSSGLSKAKITQEAALFASLVSELSTLLGSPVTSIPAVANLVASRGSEKFLTPATTEANTPTTGSAYASSPGNEELSPKSPFRGSRPTGTANIAALKADTASLFSTPGSSVSIKEGVTGFPNSESAPNLNVSGASFSTSGANGTHLSPDVSSLFEVSSLTQPTKALAVASLASELSKLLTVSSIPPFGNLSTFASLFHTVGNLKHGNNVENVPQSLLPTSSFFPGKEASIVPNAAASTTVLNDLTGNSVSTAYQQSFTQVDSSTSLISAAITSQNNSVALIHYQPSAVLSVIGNSNEFSAGQLKASTASALVAGSPSPITSAFETALLGQGANFIVTGSSSRVKTNVLKVVGASTSLQGAFNEVKPTASVEAVKLEDFLSSAVASAITSQATGEIGAHGSVAVLQSTTGASKDVLTLIHAGAPGLLGAQQSNTEVSGTVQQLAPGLTPLTSQVSTSATLTFSVAETTAAGEAGKSTKTTTFSSGFLNTEQETSAIVGSIPSSASESIALGSGNTAGTLNAPARTPTPIETTAPLGKTKGSRILTSSNGEISVLSLLPSHGSIKESDLSTSPSTPSSTLGTSAALGELGGSASSSVQAHSTFNTDTVSLPETSGAARLFNLLSTVSSSAVPLTLSGVPKGALIPAVTIGAPNPTVELESPGGPPSPSGGQASLSSGRTTNGHGGGNDSVSVILSPTAVLPFLGAGVALRASVSLGLIISLATFLLLG